MGWNGSVNGTRKDSQRNTSMQRENRVITLNSQQKNYRLFCVLSRVREREYLYENLTFNSPLLCWKKDKVVGMHACILF